MKGHLKSNSTHHVPYFGDEEVTVGEPFRIACIIPITEAIKWFKDDEIIQQHTRHGKVEHAYIESESSVQGIFFFIPLILFFTLFGSFFFN